MKRKREAKEGKQTSNKKPANGTLADIEDLAKYFPAKEEVPSIRSSLLTWFDKHKRILPWRVDHDAWNNTLSRSKNRDEVMTQRAYEVWVSEIMLQQTRVQTVIDYYNRWMKNFPTVKSLSEASLEKVNEEWSGLGYYRRAKHLLEGSKAVIDKHDGVIPQSAKDILVLPGIGQYTAGAISSIVFNEVTPLVDGNVIRVISRLCSIELNPKLSTTNKLIWKICEELVDPVRPGCFNQSLMELGATLCTPTNPSCDTCPIRSQCTAYAKQLRSTPSSPFSVTDYPVKVKKAAPRNEVVLVCCLAYPPSESTDQSKNSRADHGFKFLITKRPENGLLASLWEFPTITLGCEEDDEDENGDSDSDEEIVKKKKVKKRSTKKHPNNSESIITTNIKKRKELICEFFKKEFAMNISLDDKHNSYFQLGETSHLFTHIKQKLYVDFISIHPQNQKPMNDSSTLRWLTYSELDDAALSKGMRKCLKIVQQHFDPSKNQKKSTTKNNNKNNSDSPKKKVAQKSSGAGKQASISQFFK